MVSSIYYCLRSLQSRSFFLLALMYYSTINVAYMNTDTNTCILWFVAGHRKNKIQWSPVGGGISGRRSFFCDGKGGRRAGQSTAAHPCWRWWSPRADATRTTCSSSCIARATTGRGSTSSRVAPISRTNLADSWIGDSTINLGAFNSSPTPTPWFASRKRSGIIIGPITSPRSRPGATTGCWITYGSAAAAAVNLCPRSRTNGLLQAKRKSPNSKANNNQNNNVLIIKVFP